MKTKVSNTAMALLVAGFIPVAALALPHATHAATVGYDTSDITAAQAMTLKNERTTIINDQLKLDKDRVKEAQDIREREALRDERNTKEISYYTTDRDGDTVHRIEYRNGDIYRSPEYRNVVNSISEDREQVDRDLRAMHYDANEYRGHLFNDGLPVPEELAFASESV